MTPRTASGASECRTKYANDPAATLGIKYVRDRRGRIEKAQRHTYGVAGAGMADANRVSYTTLAYNDASQPTGETHTGGTLAGYTVGSAYNALLQRTGLTLNTSPALSHAYGFDTAGRLQTVTAGAHTATYAYVANSPLVGQIEFRQSGALKMKTTKTYDYLNRLQTTASDPAGVRSPASLVFSYNYNLANQRTRRTDTDGSYWAYAYDALGQVISGRKYWADGAPVPGQQFDYGFDDIGNRTLARAGGDANGANLRTASYTNNVLNQLVGRGVPGGFDVLGLAYAGASVTVNSSAVDYRRGEYFWEPVTVANTANPVWQNVSVTTSGGGTSSGKVFVAKHPEVIDDLTTTTVNEGYDLDGNQLRDGRWTYTWDAENRLVQLVKRTPSIDQATIPGTSTVFEKVTYEYDWQGRRIAKRYFTTAGGSTPSVTRKFLYDGWNLIAELDAANTLVRSYLWGLDLSGTLQGAGGVGGLLQTQPASGNPHWAAYDGNGNVLGWVDAGTGALSAWADYGPFGEPLKLSPNLAHPFPFRFSTKYQDDESDLYYYGYRYYSPTTGRWLSRDPLGEKAAFNLHGFVNANPLSTIDTHGREIGSICPICGGYYVGECPSDGYPYDVKPRGGGTFEFCRRYLKDPVGCCGKAANSCCGLHSYTRYTDPSGEKHGWGHAEGGPRDEPAELLKVKETKCDSCTLTLSGLKYGKGKGKRGIDATGDEIFDCLRNRPPKGPYDVLTNNCWEYSVGAQHDCGLRCNFP